MRFLTKPDAILEKISEYKPTTQRNVIISIVSILKALDNPLYSKYYEIMIDMTKKINEANKTNEKTETQKANWIDWDEVIKKFNDMKTGLKLSRNITESQYSSLLDLVVLSLYVLLPPRRNKDYIDMVIAKNDMKDTNKNYLAEVFMKKMGITDEDLNKDPSWIKAKIRDNIIDSIIG